MQRSSEASHIFFKIKLKLWENVPKEAAFKCPAAKLKFFSIRMYIVLSNSVHILKCETNSTLLST